MELVKKISENFIEYLKDESRTVGNAESISFPKTEDDIIAVLKYLNKKDIYITVQGARTGLAAAAVPFGGHVLNMSKMDKVLGCRKDDEGKFFFTVQAGIVLLELNKKIENKKFDTFFWNIESIKAYNDFCQADEMFFTPDPTENTASLGGMAACNASGARSFMYGSVRKHISAMRVVLADGSVVALKRGQLFSKGRQLELKTEKGDIIFIDLPKYNMPNTKNASGYYVEDNMDAIDLFIGSDGTLGVISQLEICLKTLPKSIWGISCFFENEKMAIDFVESVRGKICGIAAMEYFDSNALDLLRKQREAGTSFSALPEIPMDYSCCVYLELHSNSDEENDDKTIEIGKNMVLVGGTLDKTWVARTQNDIERLHFFRHAVPESCNMVIDERKKKDPIITKLGADMSVPNECLEEVFALYRKTLEENNLQSATWGHIGNNHLHVNILPRDGGDYTLGKQLYSSWASSVTKMGGAVSAEHGVGKLKAEFLEVMYGKESISQMAKLKYTLDPKGLLGSGNLFKPQKGEA